MGMQVEGKASLSLYLLYLLANRTGSSQSKKGNELPIKLPATPRDTLSPLIHR